MPYRDGISYKARLTGGDLEIPRKSPIGRSLLLDHCVSQLTVAAVNDTPEAEAVVFVSRGKL